MTKSISVGEWGKRSPQHDIEHYVTAINDGMLITACGQRMRELPAVQGREDSNSLYCCAKCMEQVSIQALQIQAEAHQSR